jgi:hypothetical protein
VEDLPEVQIEFRRDTGAVKIIGYCMKQNRDVRENLSVTPSANFTGVAPAISVD